MRSTIIAAVWIGSALSAADALAGVDTVVVDQRGADLGVVIATGMGGSEALIAMDLGSHARSEPRDVRLRPGFLAPPVLTPPVSFVELLVTPTSIRHPYAPYVYFAGRGCQGDAYISAAASRQARDQPAAVAGVMSSLFVASSRDERKVAVQSELDASGCRIFEHTVNVLPASWTMNLGGSYRLPLSW
jgi:hypothetical protein